MNRVPHELAWGDVNLSPLLPVVALAILAAWISSMVLNRLGISRYIVFPSATFLALVMAYVLLLDALWMKI